GDVRHPLCALDHREKRDADTRSFGQLFLGVRARSTQLGNSLTQLLADLHSLGAHAALRNPASDGDKISANSGIDSATLRLMATTQREELGKFLRARRAALKPELVSMPAGRRRRTPGLRREEVAQLADVGVTWYTWLEQGRDIHVSRQTVERIAHALRLTA